MEKPRQIMTALLVVLVLAGCASAPSRKDMGPPDTHALVFGSLMVKTLFLPLAAYSFRMIQVDLQAAPHFVDPYGRGGHFFTDPLPVGECLKTFTFKTSSYSPGKGGGVTITTYMLGLQEKTAIDAELTAPGLHYLGSFLFSEKIRGGYTFEPDERMTERKLLQEMLPSFTRTAWEPVIKARIKELTE